MNSLFIGIGGVGVSSVAEFAKKTINQSINQGNEFFYIDTDHESMQGIMGGNFISLSRTYELANLMNHALSIVNDSSTSDEIRWKYEHFLNWIDTKCEGIHPAPFALANSVEPMTARASLFINYDRVKSIIREKMGYYGEDGCMNPREVFVVSGTCGGTSNGILIDILYMLEEICQNNQIPFSPRINLLLVMPEGYIRKNEQPLSALSAQYRLNAFALFEEINACLKDYHGFQDDDYLNPGMQWNKLSCCDGGTLPVRFRVFDNAFLFDSIGVFGSPLFTSEIADNIVNFLLMYEEAQQIQPIIANGIRTEKFNSRNSAYIKGFATTGTFVAQTWEELTRKYVHDKFIYQMLRYGFLGSNDSLPQEQFTNDVVEFQVRIDSIIHDNDISHMISNVLDRFEGRSGFDELTRMMDFLKEVVRHNGKTPAIEEVMIDHHEGIGELAKSVILLLKEIHELTCAMCSQWAMKYNLLHALQIVERLDIIFDIEYKQKSHFMVGFEPGRYFLKKTEKRREELRQMLWEYIKYLIYRNLSNEDDGYLDHCKHILHGAIREVENKFHDCRIDGIRVEEWEHCFKKDLYSLMNNPTKAIYPNLENLIDNNTSLLREGNEVECNYAAMVRQDEDGKRPDMSFDAGNPFLLYTHKQKCIDAISQRNDEWAKRFDITSGFFAKNATEAFEIFAKEVVAEAALLSASDSLRKPFSNLVLSQEETADLASRISAFSFGINTDYRRGDAPKMDIYVADFNNLPWLRNALFTNVNGMPAYNSGENVEVQSIEMPDRITKLHFEFGYSFDDYLYFDDYRLYFEDFLRRYRVNPYAHYHQPFVDKRFLTDRKPDESLAEFLAR